MRVLLQIRPDYQTLPGGDATHARRTCEELRALGVEAELTGALAPDLRGYDLVHVFNTQAIAAPFRQAVRARSWGLPVVLSPIYWDLDDYRRPTRRAPAGRPEFAVVPLVWYLAFVAVFMVFPSVFRGEMRERMVPWAVAALAAPVGYG